MHQVNLWHPRSICPHCHHTIAFYDNIPLISWVLLRGKCRTCHAPISVLYPFIELITALLMMALFAQVQTPYIPAYFIFFSALIVSIRTDLETMLISRFMSLFLVPAGIMLSAAGLLPLSLWWQSITGALFGYALLWIVAYLFFLITGKEGLGQGDVELLAFIGSFIGIPGCWVTILLGSLTGSAAGIVHLIVHKSRKIPFGPFLALGAMAYVLLKQPLSLLIFGAVY